MSRSMNCLFNYFINKQVFAKRKINVRYALVFDCGTKGLALMKRYYNCSILRRLYAGLSKALEYTSMKIIELLQDTIEPSRILITSIEFCFYKQLLCFVRLLSGTLINAGQRKLTNV